MKSQTKGQQPELVAFDTLNRAVRHMAPSRRKNDAGLLPDGSAYPETVKTTFDVDHPGLVSTVTTPYLVALTPPPVALTKYDLLGRILSVTTPDDQSTTYSYDGLKMSRQNPRG